MMLKTKNTISLAIIYSFFKFSQCTIRVIGATYFLKGRDVHFLVFYIEKKNSFSEKEGSTISTKIVYTIYSNRCSRKHFLKSFIINKEMEIEVFGLSCMY